MAKLQLTTKKVQIDKAQATIVGVIAGAVFVAIFSLVSTKALWAQRGYQARVIDKKGAARDQLEQNVEAAQGLVTAYQDFVNTPVNILGGNPSGTGEKDGDNARLILDALPSKYDFPALTTSLEKIITDKKLKIDSITGQDEELTKGEAKDSGEPKPVDMPFQIAVSGSYASIQDLLSVFEKSIRPFQAQKLVLKGGASDMKLTLDAKTYYQPERSLDIKKEEVK